ncbi:MAG: hypothetical protein ABSD74_19885 [Rhizomicrobium sp.]|jgi:hypothetical protein
MLRALIAGAALALGTLSAAHAQIVFAPSAAPQQQQQAPRIAHKGDTSAIHSIAIISAIGQTLVLEDTAKIVPEQRVIDIKPWALDNQVEGALRQRLGGNFTVTAARADRAYLARIANSPWGDSEKYVDQYLKTVPHDGIDAFVAIIPELDDGAPGLAGLTLEVPSAGSPPLGVANFEVVVVDVRSGDIVANAYSRIRPNASGEPVFASASFPDSLRPARDFALADLQMSKMRTEYSKLLDDALAETLGSLNLGAAAPPPAARTLVPLPRDKDPYQAIHSVAVVSVIGDQMRLDQVGDTFLTQAHDTLSIGDWHLDAQIETDIRSVLAKRFSVKGMEFDRNHLVKSSLKDEAGNVQAIFPGLKTSDDVDAYIVVVKQPMQLWKHGHGDGLGIFNEASDSGAGTSTEVYASYAMVLLDAHSLKLIRYAPGTVGPPYSTPSPRHDIDATLWSADAAALTPAQKSGIESALQDLMHDSISDTLLRLELTGQTVAGAP